MPTPAEIVDLTDNEPPPGESGWVPGQGPRAHIEMVEADPSWPAVYALLEQRIRTAPGDVVAVEHLMESNARKESVIHEIYGRVLRAAGLVWPDSVGWAPAERIGG